MPYFPAMIPFENSPAMFAALAIFQSAQDPPIVPIEIFTKAIRSGRRKALPGKNFLERFLEMMIVDDAGFMEIDLGEHEIARENQAFRRVQPALGHPEGRTPASHTRNRLDGLNKAPPIETAVVDSRMMRISKQVINPVRIHLARYKTTPKQRAFGVCASFQKGSDIIGGKPVIVIRAMAVDDIRKTIAYDRCGILFMRIRFSRFGILFARKDFFSGMRKRGMADVMKERRQSHQGAMPPKALVVISERPFQQVSGASHNPVVKHRRHVHDAERVLETRVHCSGVDIVRKGELADAPQSLKRRLGNDIPLPFREGDEPVNRASELEFPLLQESSHFIHYQVGTEYFFLIYIAICSLSTT